MAKKPKPVDASKPGKKKKGKFPIVPILVLLVIVGGIVAVLAFNVLNIREQWIMPYLREAPLIGQWFPPAEEETSDESNPYANMSSEELASLISGLEYTIQKMEDDAKVAADQSAQDASTIQNLRGYESQIVNYRQIKEQFDTMIAQGDPNAYAAFFESISPENAARLYQEVIAELSYASDIKRLASTYAEMDESAAAAALETLMTTNADLVVQILANMDVKNRAAIFDEMKQGNVSTLTVLMYPTEIPAQYLPTAPPLSTPLPVSTDTGTDTLAATSDTLTGTPSETPEMTEAPLETTTETPEPVTIP